MIPLWKQVVEIEGHRIGLIGYITDLTPSITSADLSSLTFEDVSTTVQCHICTIGVFKFIAQEVESVQREARRLKSLDPPVEILVALGHAGYQDVRKREGRGEHFCRWT